MDLELPRLADTVVEGTVVRWLRRPGEAVRRGEPLVEIETDKVNTELEAPADGVLSEILVAPGETVPVGQVLARIEASMPAGAQEPARSAGGGGTAAGSARGEAGPGLSPMRRRIAERMQEARARIPQGACVREVDLSRVEPGGAGWTARFVRALALAAGASQVGVAVEVPDGLVVPVVRGLPSRTLEEVAAEVARLVDRARAGALSAEEVGGAEVTVSNLGAGGTLMAFPLVSPEEAAILAAGAIREGRCHLTLAYDRRRYDDWAADRLLARIEDELLR